MDKKATQFGKALKNTTADAAVFFKDVLKNPKIAILTLKLNQQISKGLVSESKFSQANKLFSTPLKYNEVVEYVIPKSLINSGETGEYYIKAILKEDASEVVIANLLQKIVGMLILLLMPKIIVELISLQA